MLRVGFRAMGTSMEQARRLADEWRVPAVLVERTGGHRLGGGLR